jgi:hypothetical protein
MIGNWKQQFTHNSINIPGWRSNRKIVVIESDDWGSIRIPSKQVYQKFLDKGIRVDKDHYCRYDCLATSDDLVALFEVLCSVKDKNGRHAVLTADTIVANPDFEKIKASNFSEYFYEPFTETLKKSSKHEGAFELWKQGMEAGIFHPQFHGREHLNVKKWMTVLKNDENKIVKTAFDLEVFGLSQSIDKTIPNFMGAFSSGLPEDTVIYNTILKEGIDLFFNIFGYHSLSFIATKYTWNPAIEQTLINNGIKYLQGMVLQKIPIDNDSLFKYKRNNFLGTKSKSGLVYLMRNCYFEPSYNQNFDWVSDCLNRIKIAFRWHKPATISMHRVNIIGVIDEKNRLNNLILLKKLLTEIVKRYPEVEFLSSDELGKIIENDKKIS